MSQGGNGMSISGEGTAIRQRRSNFSTNDAVASALSFYPEFNRLPERELDAVREGIIILMGRLKHVNNQFPSFRSIAISPQVKALIRHVGLA